MTKDNPIFHNLMTNELYVVKFISHVFKLTTKQNCHVLCDLGLSEEFILF